MKAIKFFAIAILFSGVSVMASAQSSATQQTAKAAARIISPITITYDNTALNFGTMVSLVEKYDVTVSAAGVRTISEAAATKIGGITSTISVPKFTVGGESGANYTITLPANGTVEFSNVSGATAMKLEDFKASLASLKGVIGETSVFTVGATLKVNAKQQAGEYIATFPVTVSYE